MNIDLLNDVLKRFWWLIILIALLVVAFTVFFTLQKKPVYSVTTTFVVTPKISDLNIDQRFDTIDTLHRRTVIATISRILTSQRFKREIYYSLKLHKNKNPDSLFKIRSSVVPDTNIIKIFVSGKKPETCLSVANEIDAKANGILTRYYDVYMLKRLDRPRLPTKPVSPVIERNIIAGAIVGILLGFITVFIIMLVEFYKIKKNNL